MKPTYGSISRYGLVALANSLDQVGPVTRTVLDAAMLHELIGGHDPKDSTSIQGQVPDLTDAVRLGATGDLSGVRIGVVKELGGEGYQDGVLARFQESVDLMVGAGAEVVEVSCPNFVHALATYYLILPAEASSNLAKFDAMRYGLRVMPEGIDNPSAEDVMRATRDAGFGDEVKRRIILGTYALSSGYYDAYYGQAQKVRTLISRDFDAAFEKADVLISPTAPTTAFEIGAKVDDPVAMYLNDLATIPANLSGVPGISVPSGLADEDGLPAGVQILAPTMADDRVYRVGAALEAMLAAKWGGPLLAQAPELNGSARPGSMTETLVPFDEVLEKYDPALGLEVHVELNTNTKMFCGCPASFGEEPNTSVCPVCLGLPGAMPVVNGKAVESAIRIGLALNCEIAEWCRFARKNYFYPDMPKNFQTSQYDEPIAFEGYMDVEVDGETFRVEIERAHMEEDTGKSLHVGGATGRIHGADYSLVDYNRAGIPLIEIVTKPILGAGEKTPALARAYVQQLRELIVALDVSEARMDQGNLRADVNLSLAPRARHARHPHRDQERQLVPVGRARGPLRDVAARRRARRRGTRSCRRPATGTRTPASPPAAARSPTPTTTATSPSPTWCRWRRRRSGSRSCAARSPRTPPRSRRGSRPSGGSPTSRCATPSAPARCCSSRRRSRPAPARSRLASGGSPSWRGGPTTPASTSRSWASRRPTWPAYRLWSRRARSTTSSPARSSRAWSPARAPRRRSSPPAGWRSSPTTVRSAPRSTTPSPPTPTSPTRSATARSPRPVR